MDQTELPYHVRIENFEGPLDLLLHLIKKNEIKSMDINDVSMMPQGLDKILSEQEMSDLMAFLLGQDQDPETDAALLR